MDTSKKRLDRMMRLLHEISPLQRMINSPGLDRTFQVVARELPRVIIHEYQAGDTCEDWEVPRGWEVVHGVMRDCSGNIVASTDECPLFVAPYSESVDGLFSKAEIEPHLRTRPDRPDAFSLEHRNAYDYALVDWGITLPYNRWQALPDGQYHISIEVNWLESSMKVAELFLPGESKETICVCGHIDELCNDDLSGCILAMELMHSLLALSKRKYSWQMLLVPEMFGPIFFMDRNRERLENTIGMLNLETVGAGEKWCLKRALRHGGRLEAILASACDRVGVTYTELGFFEGYGNDERVYAWPTFDIPGIALQRFPFDRYHTSEDTPEGLEGELLLESLAICEAFVDVVERDYIPQYANDFQPWLTRRGLYFDNARTPEAFQKFNNMVLFNIDGTKSVLDLANMAGLEFVQTWEYLEKFVADGLVRKLPLHWRKEA